MEHEKWMRLALEEACKAWGTTHPNPAVGALVVHEGRVVGQGHTAPAGGPHAEVAALASWRTQGIRPTSETTLYVTLEPCSTHGRTPPCTEAVIRSGISRVVIGALDPNPEHAGRGLEILRKAGVSVVEGICDSECTNLNLIFNHWITARRPFVAAKMATTLDGRVATGSGDSKWITDTAAREDVARWRRYFPAIGAGAGTIMHDNPRLTARIPGQAVWCPRRFILDRRFRLREAAAKDLNVFADRFTVRTTLVVEAAHAKQAQSWIKDSGATLWALPKANFWMEFLAALDGEALTGIYIEGGPGLWSDLLNAQALDYLFAYRAPILLGDHTGRFPFTGQAISRMDQSLRLRNIQTKTFPGGDQLVQGHFPT